MIRTVAVVTHRDLLSKVTTGGFHAALAERFDVTVTLVEDGWPTSIDDVAGGEDADVCLWFVRFRELREREPFTWGRFAGRRVMYDFDAHANYHRMAASTLAGEWPRVFRAQGFDTLVTTGKAVAEHLVEDGVDAVWLAKAFDPERMHPLGRERSGLCEYGQSYPARRAMRARLARADVPVTRFSDHAGLNDQLNAYLGCVVCNMAGEVSGGLGRWVNRVAPERAVRLGPGFEPMQKNFEVAAAGCAPIADRIPELTDLGFVDGDTMVGYSDLDELVERCRHYLGEPDALAAIGARAGVLSLARHTWTHRIAELEPLLDGSRP